MNTNITKSRIDWVMVARTASQKLGRKYSANYCREVATGFRSSAPLEPILRKLGAIMQDQTPKIDSEAGISALSAPSAVVYSASDAKHLETISRDLRTSLDEQTRLLAQRRILAYHLHETLKKCRIADGAVSMMNDQVRQARAATASAEQRLDQSLQMQDTLRNDLSVAYRYRGAAIVRATAAEARAAAAERALSQVLNAQRSTLFSRLWNRLFSRTLEVSA